MRNDIDIKKSKTKGKVIRKEWIITKLFDHFMLFFISTVPIGMLVFQTYTDNLVSGDNYFTAIFFIPIFLIIISLSIIYAIVNMNNLKKVTGVNTELNRLIANQVLISLGWTLYKNNKQITIAAQNDYFSDGEEMVIIYDNKNLLINCISFGKHNTKSPFHWFLNRNYEKKFIDEFTKKLQEQIYI